MSVAHGDFSGHRIVDGDTEVYVTCPSKKAFCHVHRDIAAAVVVLRKTEDGAGNPLYVCRECLEKGLAALDQVEAE